VEKGVVNGWDDPRMPTLAGMRRRGYTPEAIRNFCDRIGVAKKESLVDISLLEHCVREDLNDKAKRVMAVLNPLRLVIDNYPPNQVEEFDCPYHPQKPEMGSRKVPFSRILYIEKDDFMEKPPKKYYRLAPGREVRLRYSYIIKCTNIVKDGNGEIIAVHCTYDPETRNTHPKGDHKVEGVIHWVSAFHSLSAEVRLYDRLFKVPDPLQGDSDFMENLNENSLIILKSCRVEPSLISAIPGDRFQFERLGYFCVDPDSNNNKLVFNRTVSLRDTWAKLSEKQGS